MITIFSANYISRKPIDLAMKKFATNFSKEMEVLDIGCGYKPYSKYFKCKYIGLDPFEEVSPDIVANAWDIPIPDASVDGIILNQSLEHIEKIDETISEIKRVLKPNGVGIITAPQTMKNHSIPFCSEKIKYNNFDKSKIKFWNNDFYRFTKFGLISAFKEFKIAELYESNGYFSTIFQLINYFFSSLNIKYIFIPVYFIDNILGLSFDFIFSIFPKTGIKIFKRFYEVIYLSLTLNYIMIIKKQ